MIIEAYQAALLHAKAHRVLRTDVTNMLKQFNLTMHEWAVLSLLYRDTTIRPKQIATEFAVEDPMVTMLLNALQKRKLITRKKDKNDKRSRTLKLTEVGKKLIEAADQHLKHELNIYFDGLTLNDIEGYLKVLTKIASREQLSKTKT